MVESMRAGTVLLSQALVLYTSPLTAPPAIRVDFIYRRHLVPAQKVST